MLDMEENCSTIGEYDVGYGGELLNNWEYEAYHSI